MRLTLRRSETARPVLSPIGVDVCPRQLRAVQLERCGNRWQLLRAASWQRRESEADSLAVEGFSRRIQRTLEQAGFRGRQVVAGLSIPEVELHPLEIPDRGELQDPAKFGDAVRCELGRVGSLSAGESDAAYWRLPPSRATRTTAIGVVARSKDVSSIDGLIQSVGLDCVRVDATPCALSRLGGAIRRGAGGDPREVWSVMDIGYRMLRLVLSVGEVPVLVRHLAMGGQSWTECVAESLGLSVDAAEVHKRDHGISAADSSGPTNSSEKIATMIYNTLRSSLDAIVGEVERSYEYVMRCYPESPAGGMLVVGGGAELNGLTHHLAEKLGVEVRSLRDAVGRSGGSLTSAESVREGMNGLGCAIGLAIQAESSQ